MNENLINKAIKVATKAHEGQYRKGNKLPYIVHPMECGLIAAGMTDDPEVVAAAILHDTLEDTILDYSDLVSDFGSNVADMVLSVSENKRKDKPESETWKIRKQESLEHYRALDTETKIVLLADKLSNMRSMKEDYGVMGDGLWQKFNQKDKNEHKWYYGSLGRVLKELDSTDEYKEYMELYCAIFV